MRYARLADRCRSLPSLDPTLTYRVVADDEVPGYVWIEGAGIGDPFLNPNRRCVPAASLEIWDGADPPRRESAKRSSS
jgi:hypothetical protein